MNATCLSHTKSQFSNAILMHNNLLPDQLTCLKTLEQASRQEDWSGVKLLFAACPNFRTSACSHASRSLAVDSVHGTSLLVMDRWLVIPNNCQPAYKLSMGAFFWDYSGYSYSGLGITEYMEFQFPKEHSFIF